MEGVKDEYKVTIFTPCVLWAIFEIVVHLIMPIPYYYQRSAPQRAVLFDALDQGLMSHERVLTRPYETQRGHTWTVGSMPSSYASRGPDPPLYCMHERCLWDRQVLGWRYAVGGGGYSAPLDPPPPLQTKVIIVGQNEICHQENLVGPFLVHKFLGPRPPPLF